MYENSKLGGILIEQIKQHFIIGIGINVNDSNFDSSIEKEASSLYSILGRPIQREPLLAFILNNLGNPSVFATSINTGFISGF